MGYELFELYPVNPLQLARYRETFSPGGAKDDLPEADLLSELLYSHRDRLKVWKPDTELNRKLAFFNEGRREAVDECTRLSNAIKTYGIAPVRRASGKKTGKRASIHFRQACPKFLRQSFHEFAVVVLE